MTAQTVPISSPATQARAVAMRGKPARAQVIVSMIIANAPIQPAAAGYAAAPIASATTPSMALLARTPEILTMASTLMATAQRPRFVMAVSVKILMVRAVAPMGIVRMAIASAPMRRVQQWFVPLRIAGIVGFGTARPVLDKI